MKTKFYLFTLAASLSFVACTNEELDVISNTEVQKADLIELADVNVTVGDVDSRIANGQWETTDEIGVGFVNWADASGTTTYTGTKRTSGKWANGTDGTLYANHRLFRTEGTWKFENVVYEGLHYAYYPLDAEHVTVKPLTAAVGTTQTAGSEADFEANGIFAITPMYDLVETEAGKAPVVAFDLKTISNRLKLNLEVANFASITDPIIVKSVKVVETSATPVKTFAQKAIVGNVPTAVYTNLLAWEGLADNHADKTAAKKAVAIAEDKKLTDAVFKAGVISALDYTASEAESMSTTVKNHAGFTSDASTYSVNVFSLPVKNVPGSLKVVVETNYGTVTIAPVTTLSTNAATKAIQQYNNEKLATLLNVLKGTHDTVKFTEFGKAASVSLKLNMAEKVLTEFNVNSNDEWNDAIRIASQSTGNLTINVKKTVTADISNLPASVKTITIASGKYLNVEGQFPQDVTISGSGYVRVLANKSLIIDGTIPAPVTVSMANLVNYGEITIGENGKLDVTNVMNHATLINKKSLKVDTFVNDYDQITTDNNNHICHGIVKNYATLEVTTSFNNKGSFYTIGASANIIGTITNNGNAITEEGGSFVGISGGKMLATVNTPAQMDAAIKAQATQITVTGVVSMTEKLQVSTQIILASDAELYILGTNVGNGTSASTSLMNIDVKGVNTKISAKTLQYINVLNVTAGNDLTILTGSKLDVYKMSYDINSTVTNNGRGVVVANFTSNNGSWKGLAANKYTNNSGVDVALTSSLLATL